MTIWKKKEYKNLKFEIWLWEQPSVFFFFSPKNLPPFFSGLLSLLIATFILLLSLNVCSLQTVLGSQTSCLNSQSGLIVSRSLFKKQKTKPHEVMWPDLTDFSESHRKSGLALREQDSGKLELGINSMTLNGMQGQTPITVPRPRFSLPRMSGEWAPPPGATL
jgi:hypothetical protein